MTNCLQRGMQIGCLVAWVLGMGVRAEAFGEEADWAQFRGPGGLGVSTEEGLPIEWSADENIVWKTGLGGAGTSSPIVVGKRLFVTCYSGYGVPGEEGGNLEALTRRVVAVDADDGKVLWTQEVESRQPEQPTIRDDHGYASSTPAADDERLYAFFGKSGVFAFDHQGTELWQADVGSELNRWGSASSVVLHEGLVIVNASVESESLVALDKTDGREVWRLRDVKESWNTPLLVESADGSTELVVAVMGKVLGLDPASGEVLWTCDTDIGWYMVPSLVAEDGVVYCIGGRTGGALAVRTGGRGDVTRSHRVWTARKGSNVSSPIIRDGYLYWMHEKLGIAYCADARTGETLYEQRLARAGEVYASPVLADGRLYYVARSGRAFVLASGPRYEPLAVNDLDDGSTFNAGLAVSGGRLYLRSDRWLYCIGTR